MSSPVLRRRFEGIATFLVVAILALAAARSVDAGSDVPLPIDGALAVTDSAPAPGQPLMVYLVVTASADLPSVKLELKLPAGVVAAENSATTASFEAVAAGRTLTLAVRATCQSSEEQLLVATATLAEGAGLTLRRSFATHLHRKPSAESDAKRLHDRDGAPMLVYPSGPK